ncbi:MAG: cytidine deaminase, partial [Candidatus Thermoplasmatota archaeon]|nr:cytidine deaminase [Candidatus Thermoplasmatota archaeon]
MRMSYLAASRSNCTRRKVGAVIVKDRHVIATGYNGP